MDGYAAIGKEPLCYYQAITRFRQNDILGRPTRVLDQLEYYIAVVCSAGLKTSLFMISVDGFSLERML